MKELFKEKGLWTASLFCLAAMAANLPLDNMKLPLETGSFLIFFSASLDTKTILFLIPAASVLPMGATYVREFSSGFLKLYLVRISRMEYVKRKIIEIYAGGFLVFFLSGIVWFCLCFLFLYPLEFTGNITWNMVCKALSLLLRISLIGGITAELSGIFGTLFQNYYMSYGLFLYADHFKGAVFKGTICALSDGVDQMRTRLGGRQNRNLDFFGSVFCNIDAAPWACAVCKTAGSFIKRFLHVLSQFSK